MSFGSGLNDPRCFGASRPVGHRIILDMVWIPGGEFVMGSDRHYPEEAPAHRVRVDGFWIDRFPVTNERFAQFVEDASHATFAELPPNPAEYPGAAPHMLMSGLARVRAPERFRRREQAVVVELPARRRLDASARARAARMRGLDQHPVVHVDVLRRAALRAWDGKVLPTEAEWEFAARGGLDGAEYAWGDELAPDGRPMANIWQGELSVSEHHGRWLRPDLAGRCVPGERLRPLGHDRQRLGMDDRLVPPAAGRPRAEELLHPEESAR